MSNIEDRDAFQVIQILEAVKDGVSPLDAAVQAGWTPAQFRKRMSDRDFAQLIMEHEEVAVASVESKLHLLAMDGNMSAIALYLYNKAPHRWSDRKRVDVNTGVQVNIAVVETTKATLRELMAEDPVAYARAFAPGGALDAAIDVDATESE
ncbi:MAG TPA: hypothetical protein VNC22_23240 [Sporichthya sp.]|nr:hypothetical protein [Sporichthya sp.]